MERDTSTPRLWLDSQGCTDDVHVDDIDDYFGADSDFFPNEYVDGLQLATKSIQQITQSVMDRNADANDPGTAPLDAMARSILDQAFDLTTLMLKTKDYDSNGKIRQLSEGGFFHLLNLLLKKSNSYIEMACLFLPP